MRNTSFFSTALLLFAVGCSPSSDQVAVGTNIPVRVKRMPLDLPFKELPDFLKLWNFSDPAATEAEFRELSLRGAVEHNSAYRLQLLTQIARAEGLQRKFDEAHGTLDAVEAVIAGHQPIVYVRYLLERGRVFNSSKQADKSKPFFVDAWETAKQAGLDGLAIDAAHMLGIVEAPEEALAWNEKALALAESTQDEMAKRWLGPLYNNIGWTYHDTGNYEKALEVFKKAQDWRATQGDEETLRIAKWAVARALRSLERIDEAMAIQEALLAEHEAAGSRDGFVFEELAECHLAQKHSEQAKQYFTLAHVELSKDQWLLDAEPMRIARLKQLGGGGN